MKVGASIVCARRGGCSAAFDQLNKYFTISGMPIASSQYWNSIHGRLPGEANQDEEGKQTMRLFNTFRTANTIKLKPCYLILRTRWETRFVIP
jgi:multimeric flavodoxin WrbA